MFNLKINYFNSNQDIFRIESHDLEILLWDLGKVTVTKSASIAQFTLQTDRRKEEVANHVKNLRLDSRVTIADADLERDDVF